jgi:hypothetical protein
MFTAKFLFKDKSYFTRTGITNILKKNNLWSDENPHVIQSHHQQQQICSNLQAGVLGNCLRIPHILLV